MNNLKDVGGLVGCSFIDFIDSLFMNQEDNLTAVGFARWFQIAVEQGDARR